MDLTQLTYFGPPAVALAPKPSNSQQGLALPSGTKSKDVALKDRCSQIGDEEEKNDCDSQVGSSEQGLTEGRSKGHRGGSQGLFSMGQIDLLSNPLREDHPFGKCTRPSRLPLANLRV